MKEFKKGKLNKLSRALSKAGIDKGAKMAEPTGPPEVYEQRWLC